MSEMKPDVDLAVLTRMEKTPPVAPRKRRRLALVVSLVLVLGFAAVLLSTLGDLVGGAVLVTVVRPQPAEVAALAEGRTELQRSGWIEPDPFPVLVPALAPGVVREVLVLESDAVQADQPLARLVDEEAVLALAQAEAGLALTQAQARGARVESELARASFEAALEVTEAAATAAADFDGRTAEAERRTAAVRAAQARVRVAEEELEVQRFLATNGAAGPRQVELAQARLEAEQAGLATMEAEANLAGAEVEKARARLVRATKERELRLADRLRRETADAALAAAEGAVRAAQAERETTALRLARMTVRAPAAGVVLQRMAGTGTQVGAAGDPPLVTLYDPRSLRARIDVEQSEVGKIVVGQRAQIKSPLRPEHFFDGEVIRIVHLADVQKVTLQVHVKVLDPDAALRPELLVEVHFLAEPRAAAGESAASPMGAVWIPKRLVVSGAEGASVWVVDALSGHATLRHIQIARDASEGERALVRDGLNLSDKVIDGGRERLHEGARLSIAAEGD
jgi:RND family efflux transporter MFP subunit